MNSVFENHAVNHNVDLRRKVFDQAEVVANRGRACLAPGVDEHNGASRTKARSADMNILCLELREGNKALKVAEERFED